MSSLLPSGLLAFVGPLTLYTTINAYQKEYLQKMARDNDNEDEEGVSYPLPSSLLAIIGPLFCTQALVMHLSALSQ